MNLHHPPTDLDVDIDRFSGRAVLVPGGANGHPDYLDFVKECLDRARPNTRFFFETGAETIDQARDKADRIKALCGRA